jgi:hypothetical protein
VVEDIRIHFIYVNNENEIEKMESVDVPLEIECSSSKLSEMQLIKMIEQYRNIDFIDKKTRYKFMDIVSYIVDFHSANVMQYETQVNGYYKSYSVPQNITIPPTFAVFHSLNTIWICLYEMVLQKPIPKRNDLISILKKEGNQTDSKTKKRVRLVEPANRKTARSKEK